MILSSPALAISPWASLIPCSPEPRPYRSEKFSLAVGSLLQMQVLARRRPYSLVHARIGNSYYVLSHHCLGPLESLFTFLNTVASPSLVSRLLSLLSGLSDRGSARGQHSIYRPYRGLAWVSFGYRSSCFLSLCSCCLVLAHSLSHPFVMRQSMRSGT
jgi:hypothetical protein